MSDLASTSIVERALGVLGDCTAVSTSCASSMVMIGGMGGEVRRALDCADLCAAAQRVLLRVDAAGVQDPVGRAAITAAIAACRASAQACGAHAEHHTHCARHASSAAACADVLDELLA